MHRPEWLVSWVAATDFRAMQGEPDVGLGPVAQALQLERFERAILLDNYPPGLAEAYVEWVRPQTRARIELRHVPIASPIDHAEVYAAVSRVLTELRDGTDPRLTYHLSPGTPTMAAIWLLLAKTRFPAALIQSTRERGVVDVELPFDIAVDYLPELLADRDRRLREAASEAPPRSPAFDQIVHRSAPMRRVLAMARRVAHRNVPVLIEGESGTGKELIARACHAEGPRRHQPFVAINCGAIPPELVESELFGHVKGAFTGAARDRPGHFRAAHSGTLFLDEVGELPLATQVKLLRVLQEGEVTPIGASQPLPVDVRVIAATHRRLLDACRDGHFRFDLFYRLAVAVIVLPPLRARPGDLRLLIDTVTEELAAESHRLSEPAPRLTTGALAVLQGHRWPGNVRELRNVLRRAHLWSEDGLITEEDAREALLGADDAPVVDPILNRPLGEDLGLPDVLSEVARHYLTRALAEADGNKSRAARLVGLSSYQTLDNWLARHVGRSEGSEGER